MATGDFFGNLKDKVRSVYNGFLYNGEEELPRNQQGKQYAQGAGYKPQQPAPKTNEQRGNNVVDFGVYQQVHQQQMQQQGQPPMQQGYQPPQQPLMPPQQQAQPPMQQPAPQFQSYQRPQQPPMQQAQPMQQQAQPMQPPMQPPMPPQQEMQPQQPPMPMNGPAMLNARIINARGMGDCRSAITLLRNGDAVLIVLENINDQAEQRRLVDTLSGACYSLTATITKVSRYGVYLLAPQAMAVYADQVTNQMNGMPVRQNGAAGYQPGFQNQRAAYQPQHSQQGYAPMQQGFARRNAVQEEAPQAFYAQPAPQAAPAPSFTAQPAGYGYAPDEARAQ